MAPDKSEKKKIDREKARANAETWARQEVLKRGAINLRVPEQLHNALLDYAASKKIGLSQLLREWIEERLKVETSPDVSSIAEMQTTLRRAADIIGALNEGRNLVRETDIVYSASKVAKKKTSKSRKKMK